MEKETEKDDKMINNPKAKKRSGEMRKVLLVPRKLTYPSSRSFGKEIFETHGVEWR